MNKLIKLGAALICCAIVLKALSSAASASEVRCWYIKRNGNKTPTFDKYADELSEFDCFYIDKVAADAGQKKLYLTFDAGYDNGNLSSILDTLREENVPAAFFILKNLIYKNKELVSRMANEGHLVCNHTASHKDLTQSTKEEIEKEIYRLEEIYTKETGNIMSKYFRFPEGKYSAEALKNISDLGYKTVFWSFAYEDWDNNNQPSEQYAIKKIIENTHCGAIILLHPNSKTNKNILPTLIKLWKSQGYQFGTLDELTANK